MKKDTVISDEDIVKQLKLFIPDLEKNNIDLVLELHGGYATGDRMKSIIDNVNSSHIHINYDTGNALFWGGLEVDEMLRDLKKNINLVSYMHLKDKLDDKRIWNFPAIGKGYIPFRNVFDILKDNNNDSTLCVEIEFTEKGVNDVIEVDNALKDSADYLKALGFNLND